MLKSSVINFIKNAINSNELYIDEVYEGAKGYEVWLSDDTGLSILKTHTKKDILAQLIRRGVELNPEMKELEA